HDKVRNPRAPLRAAWKMLQLHTVRLAMTVLLNIDVPDVEAGVRFYTAAFGLKVGRRFGTDFVELLGWPAPVYLLTKAAGTVGAGGDLRRYARHWTPIHPDRRGRRGRRRRAGRRRGRQARGAGQGR